MSTAVSSVSPGSSGLSDNGFDVAYLLATQRTYPSGYMAENGATTIWELWNGDKADPKMNSGNHGCFTCITWCVSVSGGIQQKGVNVQQVAEVDASVAYKHIVPSRLQYSELRIGKS